MEIALFFCLTCLSWLGLLFLPLPQGQLVVEQTLTARALSTSQLIHEVQPALALNKQLMTRKN